MEQPAAAAKTKAPVKEMEVEGLETPRDMLGDLDGLLSQLDEQSKTIDNNIVMMMV